MNDYNKRFLKNALEDLRDENDKIFLKEIEDAANNPKFANSEDDNLKMKKQIRKASRHRSPAKKILLRVASVFLVILIGFTVTTLSVKSLREKLWRFFTNAGNSSYSVMVASEDPDTNELATYEGKYIPTFIPEGYSVSSIENSETFNMFTLADSDGHLISFSEFDKEFESKMQLDKESFDTYESRTVSGCQATLASKDDNFHLVIIEIDAVIYITFNDSEIDFFGFASHIQKK